MTATLLTWFSGFLVATFLVDWWFHSGNTQPLLILIGLLGLGLGVAAWSHREEGA